jgi:hypothetical protein
MKEMTLGYNMPFVELLVIKLRSKEIPIKA